MKSIFLVTITDPQTPAGMNSDIIFKLIATLEKEKAKTYGNGFFLRITNDSSDYENIIDLRFEKGFEPEKLNDFIQVWASNYWSGKNGSYILKNIKFLE